MTYTKETLQEAIVQKLRLNYGCTEKQATDGEIMKACALVLRDIMAERGVRTREEVDSQEKRKVHYMSMEFLMGRSLMKNAYNLELLEPLTGAVEALGFKAADIFDMEPDAGLGNGGLGRLAACYLDSMTTLEIPATGYSICYELGIFKQKIVDGQQVELPDDWKNLGDAWLMPKPQETEEVHFGGKVRTRWDNGHLMVVHEDYTRVLAVPCDMEIAGYDTQQVNTLREKNEMEQALHQQETQALELQNRMERSRMQQLRSQIDPHFLFNTLNVILQTAGQEKAYRTQALITALSHLLRYSLMSNDEQVPLAREVRIVDEYYSIYHVRFGDRVKMRWCISDSIDLTETMVPSFILQPIVENAFKHGIAPKEEGGAVRIRITPLREQGLLRISVCDNGLGIEPEQLARLQAGLAAPGDRWEHIGVYNVAARLRLLDKRCRFEVRSHPGRGTAVSLYLPLVELTEEEDLDDDSPVDCG